MFSEIVKEASKAQHVAAERSPFLVALMKGSLGTDAYRDYLTQLAPIYEALESWDSIKGGDLLGLFDHRLDRFEHIICDIESLGGSKLVCDETIAYVTHLNTLVEAKDRVRLLAHHYTRYLGDLSGGQAIASLVMRNLSLPPTFMTFYSFDDIDDKVRYKEDYKQKLDSLDLSPEQVEIFITEVQTAFEFNQRIFTALGNRWLKD